jgi:hypothetical protein
MQNQWKRFFNLDVATSVNPHRAIIRAVENFPAVSHETFASRANLMMGMTKSQDAINFSADEAPITK